MKIRVTFKTPYVLEYPLANLLGKESDMDVGSIEHENMLEERESLKQEVEDTTNIFIENNEYITIEFDTVTKSAEVIARNKV